mgnify:CR=1 FL=1
MKIIVGIDFGKYIGVSKTDTELKIPMVYGVFLFKTLVEELNKIKPDIIVAGLPLSLNGKEGEQCIKVRSQCETLLKQINCKPEVYFQDERFSSKFTKNHAESASWILETFFKKNII